jgi:NADPH-dependent 2,4-dienoyl-CoA reductase/sulfur reductase-like enzyme
VYGVGDVARWYNPLFGTEMRVEHRRNASEQAAAVARNLLEPDARTPFAPVPYFWSDQYDVKIQAYGHLREHEDAVIVYGDVAARRLLVAYRNEDRLTGVLAVGQSSRALRSWRALIAARCTWRAALAIA